MGHAKVAVDKKQRRAVAVELQSTIFGTLRRKRPLPLPVGNSPRRMVAEQEKGQPKLPFLLCRAAKATLVDADSLTRASGRVHDLDRAWLCERLSVWPFRQRSTPGPVCLWCLR